MENDKVLPDGRTIDSIKRRWSLTSDEWIIDRLVRNVGSAGKVDTHDACALLALATNGFLDIQYSASVQDSSVLLQVQKINASLYKDGGSVWSDTRYPETISIIHKVSENHPFHSFIQNVKDKLSRKYNCLDGSSFPYISPILTLSELLLLIGTEKLRLNYRNILHRLFSSRFRWGFQKKLDNWDSFALEILDIKNGSVLELNPIEGTLLPLSLDLSNTTYTAIVKTKQECEQINMLLLSDEELSSHCEKGQIRILDESSSSLLDRSERFDFVFYNHGGDNYIPPMRSLSIDNIVRLMSTGGKALGVWGYGDLRRININQYLHLFEAIILLERHGVILLNKNKECTDVIKVYDRAEWNDFTAERLLDSMREQEDMYILTLEDINDMGGCFDISAFKRNQYKIDARAGEKLIKLSEVLTLQNGYRLSGSIKDVRFLHSDIKDYTPLSPYVTAKNGEYISESRVKNREYRLVDQRRLVVLAYMTIFRTFIFDPRDGEAGIHPISFFFDVDEEKVNIDYLVYQMNEEYFLNQLFPSGRVYIHPKAKDILSCQILVPDVESSVERQKQFIEDLRQREIARFAKKFGYDLGKFVQYKATDLLKGTVLCNGKYTIIEAISHGGFGKVYKARDEETGEIVAIKEFFYHSRQVRDPETNNVRTNFADIGYVDDAKDKFRREKAKIQECAHDNIVKVYEEFEENNTCYYSMEYIDGKNLKEYRKIGEREALAIIRQVAEALKAMHEKRYNHSDVKPQNILLDSNGVATLIDFTGAHHYGDDEMEGLSKTGNSVPMEIMTPGYTPKQAYKMKGFHAGRDIYSLGATLYYMLTGNEPATIDNKAKPAKMSSKSWRAICSAVEEDPRKWLRSMDEFLALLPGDEEIGDMDVPKPTKNLRITPRPVVELKKDEVFVFGSNLAGHHSGGAAKQALKWGAKWYVASGPMGQTYGIPTVGVHGLDAIEKYVSQFIKYVGENDHITFYVTAIGCGSAGFTPEQIAPLFKDCVELSNVYLPESFWKVLMNKGFIKAEDYKATLKGNHAKDRGMQESGDKKCDEAGKYAHEKMGERKGSLARMLDKMKSVDRNY